VAAFLAGARFGWALFTGARSWCARADVVRAAMLSGLNRRASEQGPTRSLGMATAEYAVATLAACGFAALLMALLRSDEVRGLLLSIVRRALSVS